MSGPFATGRLLLRQLVTTQSRCVAGIWHQWKLPTLQPLLVYGLRGNFSAPTTPTCKARERFQAHLGSLAWVGLDAPCWQPGKASMIVRSCHVECPKDTLLSRCFPYHPLQVSHQCLQCLLSYSALHPSLVKGIVNMTMCPWQQENAPGTADCTGIWTQRDLSNLCMLRGHSWSAS